MGKVAAFCKAVPLMVVAVILLGGVTIGTANADSHLPDCKANPKCLLELGFTWKTITAADVQVMINAGANVNAKNFLGQTPLHEAIILGNAKVIPVLVKVGADVNAKDKNGFTPLHGAAEEGQAEVIPVLVQAGADVNEKTNDGFTPLHIAAANGKAEVIPVLVKIGADVNAKGNDGVTPLHLAAIFGKAEVISMLIKHGAYIQATDNKGITPLDFARSQKQWNAVKILEDGSGLASPSCFNIIRGKPNQVVWVNGIPMKLLIDTGADSTHLTKQQAKMAGVQITGEGEFVIADGSVVVNKIGSANISLGDELSGNFPVSIGKGKGLLGRDVLDQFACQ